MSNTPHPGPRPARRHPQIIGWLLAAALIAPVATSSRAQTTAASGWTRADLQQVYLDHLKAEGFQPEALDVGVVRFKREGRYYTLSYTETDPNFLVLRVSFKWEMATPEDRNKVLEAANYTSSTTKVAKVLVGENGTLNFQYETVQPSPQDGARILTRAFGAIDAAMQRAFQRLRAP